MAEEFNPTSLGLVELGDSSNSIARGVSDSSPADFNPASIGLVPLEDTESFDPRSVGLVPVEEPKPVETSGGLSSFAGQLGSLVNKIGATISDLPKPVEASAATTYGKAFREEDQPELDQLRSEIESSRITFHDQSKEIPWWNLKAQGEASQKFEDEQKKRIARVNELVNPRKESAGELFRTAAAESFPAYGASPESKNVMAQLGRGAANVAGMVPAMFAGEAALPLMAIQGAGDAYQSTLMAGGTEEQAIAAAKHTAPALLLYMVGGRLASGLAGKLVGQEASALTRGLVGAGTASVANVGTSSVLRALEAPSGQKLSAAIPSIESLTADTLFGVYHGVGEYRSASLEAKRKAYEELQKRGFTKDDANTTPTEVKAEAVVEKTPEEMVADTAKPEFVSTAINTPEGIVTGPATGTPHPEMMMAALEKNAPFETIQDNLGFAFRKPDGGLEWVDRVEAGKRLTESGQLTGLEPGTPLTSEHIRGEVPGITFNPKGGEPNAVSIKSPDEEVLRPPEQGSGTGMGLQTVGEGNKGQEAPSGKETKVTIDQAAEALKPFRDQAIASAKSAGATDAELAADTAWSALSQQVSEGKTSLDNPGAIFSEAARKEGLKQLEASQAQKRGGGKVETEVEPTNLASAEAGGPTPAQEVVRKETVDTLTQAIDTLPDLQKKVMQRTLEEASDKEIAAELGITEPQVRKARQTARESLREKLSSKVDWTGATDDSSLIDDIRSDISAIKAPQKVGILPSGSGAIHDAFTKVKDIATEALSIGKVNDLRRSILHWVAKVQRSFGEVSDAQKSIMRTVRDPIRRDAITNWIEAGGDMVKLKSWETASKDPKLKDGYKAAQNLTPEEITLATKIKSAFDTMHARGVANDVLEGFRDNYVNHIWEKKPQKLSYSSKSLRDNFRFSRARTFNSFFEGEQAGYKPKTKDIAKLLPVYIHEMNGVIAARQLVADLSKGTADDGRPLVSPRGNVDMMDGPEGKAYLVTPKALKDSDTKDYRVLSDQPALTTWRWKGEDENGNPFFMKSDLALHPDAYDRLQKALGVSIIKKWYSSPGSHLASIPKSIARALDNTQSIVKQTMLGFLSTFHVVQEGTHAVGHKINPFHVKKTDLNDPAQYDAAKHGLMLNPDRISERTFMEGLGQSGIISRIPGIGRVADAFSNWMFHTYIPGLKYKTYEAIRGRNMERFKDEISKGEISEEQVKVLSAEQTNAAYGHLNYADLGRDPTMQHLMQLALLAPDFLEARGRFAAQAAKAIASKTGREQFWAIALLAATQMVVSQTISKLADGKFHLDHPFEIIIGDRRYTLRSVPEDIFSMIKDTRRFTYGRLNPLLSKAWQGVSGLNYRGEKVSTKETIQEALAQAIPLTIQSLPAVRQLTETGRNQPISPLEQFAGSMGLRISRYSPVSDMFQKASEWQDKQGIPRDRGSYPISKYQQLRYALEDGDMDKAKAEFKKLQDTMKRDKIISGFEESTHHPFTQSQAMDVKFFKSLGPEDKEKYKLAKEKRKDIMRRFYSILRHP